MFRVSFEFFAIGVEVGLEGFHGWGVESGKWRMVNGSWLIVG
jgi:hypothetical protein